MKKLIEKIEWYWYIQRKVDKGIKRNVHFIPMFNRLQKCSEMSYPYEPKWDEKQWYEIAYQWVGKFRELTHRVWELEHQLSRL